MKKNARVYEIDFDVERYQRFLFDGRSAWTLGDVTFDAAIKGSTWRPPRVYQPYPTRPEPDFWYLSPGAIIVSPEAYLKIESHFVRSGEILPLPFERREFKLLNVTACFNCLDQDKCEWAVVDGKREYPEKFVFRADRMLEYPCFKVPESPRTPIFCPEWSVDPQEEFKAAVEELGLTGLIFKLVWEG